MNRGDAEILRASVKPMRTFARRMRNWFFAPDSDEWLSILRTGVGALVVLYGLSLRNDWNYFLGSNAGALINRRFAETIVDLDAILAPKVSWFVRLLGLAGVAEATALSILWILLIAAGTLLMLGLFSRAAAVACWLLHLAVVKSTLLLSYGLDNFTTIASFYLMLSPLPDRLSLDCRWRNRNPAQDRQLLGFFRRVLQVHLCFIYFFSGLTKALGPAWWNGTSLWRALTRAPFNVIPAPVLAHWKYLFPAAGIVVWLLELLYPICVWPRQTQRVCLIAVLAMHAGIGVAMGMYLFATVMIVLNLAAFGPGHLWRTHDEIARDVNGEAIVDLAAR